MALSDDELQELYAARPSDFVRIRNDLARRLRKEDRRDDADTAAKLRRPSVTAAALNQVAREAPQLIEAFLAEGALLRAAMQRAIDGDAADVRPAQAAERRAADAVVVAARHLVEALGQRDTDANAQRINNTVRAVALDDSLAQRLRRGLLEDDVVASGFGFGGLEFGEGPPESPRPAKRLRLVEAPPAPPLDDRQRELEVAERLAALRAEAEQRADRAARLASAADEAQRLVDRLGEETALLQSRLRDAQRDARRARRTADKAGVDATRARKRADAAVDEGDVETQTR
ncbi:MAG: hypothetical protein ABIQ73_11745 [Acidimicrobiales bacterium]